MTRVKSIAAWLTWPGILFGSLAAFDRALTLGFDPGLTLFALTVANITLIAGLELWLPEKAEWNWTGDRQVFNDLAHGGALQLGGALGNSLLVVLFATLGGKFAAQNHLGLWPTAWPLWTQVIGAMLIVDFFDYWKHRAYHDWPIAWPIHALHHNADRMHVFKGARLHFLEATIRALVVFSPLVVLGAPSRVLFWVAAVMNFGGNLNHSNLMQKLPRWVHAVFTTQRTHWLHHSKDYGRGTCNFASFSPLFDHLFGTFRQPLDEPVPEMGIAPDPIPGNLAAQLASPILWPWLTRRGDHQAAAEVGR